MGLFKKKVVIPEKPKKMDLSMYRMDLTIKAICMYERMSGNSFFHFKEEDVVLLLYCTFYTSNKVQMTYEVFGTMLNNPDLAQWVARKYMDILSTIQQFSKEEKEEEGEEKKGEEESEMRMTDLATSLIVDYGVDAAYVMERMDIWEIEALYKACDSRVKRHYEEERLWSYIGILPHVDGKKIKGPDDLLPFPWEKDEKKKRIERDIENNMYAIKHNIGRSIDDILNGKV